MFDTVDHHILIQQLINIGFSDHTVGWLVNYLTDRTQATQFEGFTSGILTLRKGVPQGSVLGLIALDKISQMQLFISMRMIV